MMSNMRDALSLLLMATLTTSATAQVGGGGRGGRGSGTVDTTARRAQFAATGLFPGWAGTLECVQCTVHVSPGGTWVEFGAEPVVRGRLASASVMLQGDVLVAVDNLLITTPEGGRRLSGLGGLPERFTIRRNGRELVLVGPGNLIQWRRDSTLFAYLGGTDSAVARLQWRRDSTALFQYLRGRDSASIGGQEIRDSARRALVYRFGRGTRLPSDSGTTGDRHLTVTFNRTPIADALDVFAKTSGRSIVAGRTVATVVPTVSMTITDKPWPDAFAAFLAAQGLAATITKGDIIRVDVPGELSKLDSIYPVTHYGTTGAEFLLLGVRRGWLGFGLDCRDCSATVDSTGTRMWRFPTFPTVAAIDPAGPADIAGLLAGDVLRLVDGESVTSAAGAARFSKLKAGDRARLTVDRKGRAVEVVLTVGKVN